MHICNLDYIKEPAHLAKILLASAGVPPRNQLPQVPGDQYGITDIQITVDEIVIVNHGITWRLHVRSDDVENLLQARS